MATFRAIESCKPEKERLVYDPFAAAFLSKFYQTLVAVCALPFIRKIVTTGIQLRWPGTFTSAVARTKLIDDMIIDAVKTDGINQIIIVSATLDTRAHRLNIGVPVHYVEVDHPKVQYAKRAVLAELQDMPTVRIDYVPLDLNTQQMSDVIPQLLQRNHNKTLFLWEALTTSMEAREADTIFKYINNFPSGTQVIFTYIDKAVLENPKAFNGFVSIDRILRRSGENWDFGLHPGDLNSFMEARNMKMRYEGGAEKYRAQYFGNKSRRMKGYEYFRVVRGEVK
ncbi:class I SAM-dependent methyltransferase [Chitinophaga niastensis]|nr:SAM-dependent methyltransferase [Chitinophaga niastensis]